jgi:hypothetical protein
MKIMGRSDFKGFLMVPKIRDSLSRYLPEAFQYVPVAELMFFKGLGVLLLCLHGPPVAMRYLCAGRICTLSEYLSGLPTLLPRVVLPTFLANHFLIAVIGGFGSPPYIPGMGLASAKPQRWLWSEVSIADGRALNGSPRLNRRKPEYLFPIDKSPCNIIF